MKASSRVSGEGFGELELGGSESPGLSACVPPFESFRVALSEASGYWTVVDSAFEPVEIADGWLRDLRYVRDRAESTTRKYAGHIARYLTWLAGQRLDLEQGPRKLSLFVLLLRNEAIAVGRNKGGQRDNESVNAIVGPVRRWYSHLVAERIVDPSVLSVLWEVDERNLPAHLSPTGQGPRYRPEPRHHLRTSRRRFGKRASQEEFEALLLACRNWRDRFLLILLWFAGLRRGQALGLRRSDVHFALSSLALGCEVEGPHLHVIKRDNVNRASAKRGLTGKVGNVIPAHPYVLAFYERYLEERYQVRAADGCDFVFVNLFAEPLGEPMKLHAVDSLFETLCRRAGIERGVTSHWFRRSAGTRWAELEGLDVARELLTHDSLLSTQPYVIPTDERLRHAVDGVTPLTRRVEELLDA